MNFYKKLFIFCAAVVLVVLAYCLVHFTINNLTTDDPEDYFDDFIDNVNVSESKFILQWTPANLQPFSYMRVGRKGFIDRKCEFTNCVVTSRRDLLNDVTDYDVIVFDGSVLVSAPFRNNDLPPARSPRQKYVFASMESADNYPICSERFDGFFNWTWTYRLDSDARWGYMLVKDSNGMVIGPNKVMYWMKIEDMKPVSQDFKESIKTKKKAAAWFVSNCKDKAGRFVYANELKKELQNFDLDLDIFGRCGTMTCKFENAKECDKMIADTYYFYLAFENSFSEDYVTEKLLRALKNDAVPVVYGGANYTRFMPDGIYLNARELGPKLLAETMHKLIEDPEQYSNFFKWKNHYSYHSREETPQNNDYCQFCAMINDKEKIEKVTTIQKFRNWWDPQNVTC